MKHILEGLNDKQIEAVRATEGPVLVISGPGSGKTRCLTHRVAYLIASGIKPADILAVTFTNKAANEIKERVGRLLKTSENKFGMTGQPTLGTFHSVGLQILRREIPFLGYERNFTILDKEDQIALVKRILKDMELDIKKFSPALILAKISKLKTELISPAGYNPGGPLENIIKQVYVRYQKSLQQVNSVDFDDLIGLPVAIFRKHPDILEKYQNRWRYILIDEYQDTSHDQYTLVNLLAAKHKNIFCIGDDAQSIYMFREADIRNILNFQKDYPGGKIILLEQNYRSTKNIISAAQSIISNNKSQMQKELWTKNTVGEKITTRESINERDEANFVTSQILELTKKDSGLNDFTVLYRTHAQSRAMEEAKKRGGSTSYDRVLRKIQRGNLETKKVT
jgi:DNA helicase-2/ATP-dependent DNA helicase PcrA